MEWYVFEFDLFLLTTSTFIALSCPIIIMPNLIVKSLIPTFFSELKLLYLYNLKIKK